MHTKNILAAGKPVHEARRALILLHGRGAGAEDILSLAAYFNVKEYALLAPQATNNTWYPFSFIAPVVQNEPWLSSALAVIHEVKGDLNQAGISDANIYFAGFSQGACLTLEYVTRNATRFGGVAAFTGGLIGDKIYSENYRGDFQDTPVFIGTSDPDPHVPVERVKATASLMQSMNAKLTSKIYSQMGHTVNDDEIQHVNTLIFR